MPKNIKDEFRGKRVVVAGLGVSGLHAARWLAEQGAAVTLSEIRPLSTLDPAVCRELVERGVRLEAGGHREETFLGADAVIVSPGVPLDLAPLQKAGAEGIPLLGELELASRLIDTPMIAVTGTNGKSTVTAMLGELLKNAGRSVFVGGNIGTPLMAYAASGPRADYAVVEVSSFQLDTIRTFSPLISILLNISPDHLDRYPDYGAYVRSKLRIMENQGTGQHAVLNDDDPALRAIHARSGVEIHRYGLNSGKGREAFRTGKEAVVRLGGAEESYALDSFCLPGEHNVENLLAVLLAGALLRVGPEAVRFTMETFRGLPNRLARVAEVGGVAYYNDSKATNVDAAVRAVESLARPLILIAGGRHKGGDYAPLVKAARGKVRKAVLIGEAAGLLAEAFSGTIPYEIVGDMDAAVLSASASAARGDAVLLAPACSSFDMYSDYAHRGRAFRASVEKLAHG
jgi:UDP-N-acetylmuramoylalanine--D-glutamate ligase